MIPSATTEPFGIYVHVPFCEQKCAYCDFFTVTDPTRSHPLYDRWLMLCLQEFRLWVKEHPELAGREITTVFFGGGTPSLLPPESFRVFLEALRGEFNVANAAEISLETQPGTLGPDDYFAMTFAGINRFSIGAQTFNERLLQPTARRHTAEETELALKRAEQTGAAVSLDMICALPGQTLTEWKADLEHAVSFEPRHMSVYEMTFHAGTDYYRQWKRGVISEADEGQRVEMFQHTRNRLREAGYHHYEISNYAKPGYESRHNRLYWTLGDFVGLGAGAHSFVGGHRYANPRSISGYAKTVEDGHLAARNQDSADPDITLVENLQMVLRLIEGVDLDWLASRLGEDIRVTKAEQLHKLSTRGWIYLPDKYLRLTEEGLLQADSVTEMML